MMTEWIEQIQNSVNTLERLKDYIKVTPPEEEAILTLNTKWGSTPYFAALMDPDDPDCPVRKQIVPEFAGKRESLRYQGFSDLEGKRAVGEIRPDSIARQYHDRIAFTVSDVCANYCRHCFRKELVVDRS